MILAGSAVVGFLLLSAVFSLQVSGIRQHIKESLDIFINEGDYPRTHSWTDMWRDNFTDNIMIGNAGYDGDEPLIDRVLSIYRVTASYEDRSLLPSQVLIAQYHDDLADAEGITFSRSSYEQYWHGYLVFLKPLLSLFTYFQIRIINGIAQILLLLAALYLMWKKNRKGLILPFVIIWGILTPSDTMALLQYSDIYYIYSIGTIIVLAGFDEFKEGFYYLFLGLGIATSFFDFLTYPLVSLAVPLCVFLYMRKSADIKQDLISIIVFSALWTAGYIGMWGFKWILLALFSGGIWEMVLGKIAMWTSSTSDLGDSISIFSAIARPFVTIITNPFFLASLAYMLVSALISVRFAKHEKSKIIIFGIMALYPIAWFLVIKSHSYSHYWFSHKELIIFSFALMLMFTPEFEIQNRKRNGQKRQLKKR